MPTICSHGEARQNHLIICFSQLLCATVAFLYLTYRSLDTSEVHSTAFAELGSYLIDNSLISSPDGKVPLFPLSAIIKPTTVCARFGGYEGVVASMLSRNNVSTFIRRFDYINTERFSLMGFYAAGRSTPGASNHEAHLVEAGNQLITIVPVAVEDEYPPQALEFQVMAIISSCLGRTEAPPRKPPSFILRVDYDAFVSPDYLDGLSDIYSDPAKGEMVMGDAVEGTPMEVGLLGFPPGISYCNGGTTVAYGHQLLQDMEGRWEGCTTTTVTRHSDTEIQRCIFLNANVSCTQTPYKMMLVSPLEDRLRLRHPLEQDSRDLILSSADSRMATAHVVHPLKHDLEFQSVREAHLFKLAPPTYSRHIMHDWHWEMKDICVLNR